MLWNLSRCSQRLHPMRIFGRTCFKKTTGSDNVVFPILTEAVKNKDYNLIAHLIETQDPYEIKRVKMPVMTSASSPNLVASDASSRMIGCVCEPVADAINWMELVKGDPVKCYCGHWFQLVSYEEYFRRVNCPSVF